MEEHRGKDMSAHSPGPALLWNILDSEILNLAGYV